VHVIANSNAIIENNNSICYVLYRPFIPKTFIKISYEIWYSVRLAR